MPLDPTFWENERRRLLAILLPRLAQMALTGMVNAARQAGIAFDNTLYNQRAEAWARTYTDQLLEGFISTSKANQGTFVEGAGQAVADWISRPGATVGELNAEIGKLYSPERASVIAVTETTRAFANGQLEAYKAEGIDEIIWATNKDALVCSVCGPLNNKRVKIGSAFGKDKKGNDIFQPPGHIGCRCWIRPGVGKNKELRSGIAGTESGKNTSRSISSKVTLAGVEVRNKLQLLSENKNKLMSKFYEDDKKLMDKINSLSVDDPELEHLKTQRIELTKERAIVREKILFEQRSTLYVPNPVDVKVFYDNKESKRIEHEQAIREFSNMVTRELPTPPVIIKIHNDNRSVYDGNLNVRENATVDEIIHELGHHLESSHNEHVLQRAVEFYNLRTRGYPLESVQQITGDRAYDKDEMTRRDKFFDPYIGIEYKDKDGQIYATEIISMGMQYMWKDPVKFAEEDPDYFDFMIDILRKAY